MHKISATETSARHPEVPGRIILIEKLVTSGPLCRPWRISTLDFCFGARNSSVYNQKRLRVEQETKHRNLVTSFIFLEKLFSRSRDEQQIPMPGKVVLDGTETARSFFSKIISRSVLRSKTLIALMATKTSEWKQRCLSHVGKLIAIRH